MTAWKQMVDYLNGSTMRQPQAAALSTRRHVCADADLTERDIADAIAAGATAAEIATMAGITRQAAHARITRHLLTKGHPQHGTL